MNHKFLKQAGTVQRVLQNRSGHDAVVVVQEHGGADVVNVAPHLKRCVLNRPHGYGRGSWEQPERIYAYQNLLSKLEQCGLGLWDLNKN